MGQSIGRAPARAAINAGDINDGIITAAKVAADVATQAELDGLVDSAPGALDTLNELAAALNDDADFSTSVATSIATKLPLAGGAMTGAITTNSTFDGIDIATRDGVLTSTTTTAGAALPKAGGTMTGNIVMGDDTSIGISDSAERIEFDGAGDISVLGANFGIGDATPGAALAIESDANSGVYFKGGGSASSAAARRMTITHSNTEYAGDTHTFNALSAFGRIVFAINGSEKMRIEKNGDIETSTAGKIKQKGAFMQSSTHQALVLGY